VVLSYLRKNRVLRHILARPRLLLCALGGILSILIMPADWHLSTRLLLGWNVGAWNFLAFTLYFMLNTSEEHMRRQAIAGDESAVVILTIAVLAAVSSLAAIFAQLANLKDVHGQLKFLHLGLVIGTVFSAWLFIHLMFALHYVHQFLLKRDYVAKDSLESIGGLRFPGAPKPDFADFLYFSFVIASASATADVEIWSKSIRRTATLHSVVSFFFNTTIIALLMNIGAGLAG
jgi:uncharacterized membrane protein